MKRFLTFIALIMLFLPLPTLADAIDQNIVLSSNTTVRQFHQESRSSAVKVVTQRGHGSGSYIKIGRNFYVLTARHVVDAQNIVVIQAGAEAIAGGKICDRKGYFFESTVLNNVTQDMTVAREEIFGPVLSIIDYEDPEEAIKIANDTEYGLAAGIFTNNIDQATIASNQLEAGQIYVNSWFTGSIATPFGGYKQSGFSREKGQQALKSYLQVKNVGIQL